MHKDEDGFLMVVDPVVSESIKKIKNDFDFIIKNIIKIYIYLNYLIFIQ